MYFGPSEVIWFPLWTPPPPNPFGLVPKFTDGRAKNLQITLPVRFIIFLSKSISFRSIICNSYWFLQYGSTLDFANFSAKVWSKYPVFSSYHQELGWTSKPNETQLVSQKLVHKRRVNIGNMTCWRHLYSSPEFANSKKNQYRPFFLHWATF